MARASHLDIAITSIGGINLRGDEQSVTLSMEAETVEGKSMGRLGASPQLVKRTARFDIDLLNAKTLPNRVSNLDFTALSIGGTSYIADVSNLAMSGTFGHVMIDAVGDEWRTPQVVSKDYSGTVDLMVPTGSMPFLNTLDGANTGWYVTLTFTLNSVVITLPVLIKSIAHSSTVDDIQKLRLSWVGRDPQSGDYPTAPTGTTSLLEKALNAPETELAIEYETKAVNGTNATGNVVFAGFSFEVANAAIVKNSYQFIFSGAPTNVLSS